MNSDKNKLLFYLLSRHSLVTAQLSECLRQIFKRRINNVHKNY